MEEGDIVFFDEEENVPPTLYRNGQLVCKIKKYVKAWSIPTIGGLVGLDGIRSEGRRGISVCAVAFFCTFALFPFGEHSGHILYFWKIGFSCP